MRDEMDARFWAAHGHAFSLLVANAFNDALAALRRLNQIQFNAPWRKTCAR